VGGPVWGGVGGRWRSRGVWATGNGRAWRRWAPVGHGEGGQRPGMVEAGAGEEGGGGSVRWGPPGGERGGTWAGLGKGEAGRA
jgi:hypothetical protein